MNMNKIFATDLDGTFLRSDHSFDQERLKRILEQFRERGYLFVAASGRSFLSLQSVFAGFEEDMAFLAENGSLVAYRDQMIFEEAAIPREVYLPLIQKIKEGPFGSKSQILLSGKNGGFLLDSVLPDYYNRIIGYYPNCRKVENFHEVTDAIVKLVVTFSEEELEAANHWLNTTFPDIQSVTTGFDSMDIILNGGNKAAGLSYLCEYFGLTSADVIAFGDNQNDLEMLDFAGYALATSNARPEAKAIADDLIGHCNDDAVLEYIEEYLMKEQSSGLFFC